MRISAFNRSCERKQSRIYPSKSLKKGAISFDHDPILFSTANPADEVFGKDTPSPPRLGLDSRVPNGGGGQARHLATGAADNAFLNIRSSFPGWLGFFPSVKAKSAAAGLKACSVWLRPE